MILSDVSSAAAAPPVCPWLNYTFLLYAELRTCAKNQRMNL